MVRGYCDLVEVEISVLSNIEFVSQFWNLNEVGC